MCVVSVNALVKGRDGRDFKFIERGFGYLQSDFGSISCYVDVFIHPVSNKSADIWCGLPFSQIVLSRRTSAMTRTGLVIRRPSARSRYQCGTD